MICKLCGVKIKRNSSFSAHITRTHKITTKEYYDTFIKKDKKEGKCAYCGNKTEFNNLQKGYHEFCSRRCASVGTTDRKIKTCLKHSGYEYPGQIPKVRKKIDKTVNEKYGGYTMASKQLRRKAEATNEKRHRDSKYNNREKARKTCIKLYNNPHYNNPKKSSETYYNKTGYHNPSQNPEVHRKQYKSKEKPKSELKFIKLLKNNNIKFKVEYYIKKDCHTHYFDFAIIKNNKINCLVEIDGEWFHNIISDPDGIHTRYLKDYLRWKLVPNKVKFLIIDSKRLDEGFKELQRILPMKYKDWKKEMLNSIPKSIEDVIPKFSKKRMLRDYEHLCKYKYYKNAFLGKSILFHFCKSRIIELLKNDWKSIRKTLYKSPCSKHHLLEGFDIFKNVSKLREKFRKKYKGINEVIVKHHSPEKMLAICSLGKTYISKERIDKESKRIIKFLKLKTITLNKKGK